MNDDPLYSFVFRGLLTDEALDKTSRLKRTKFSTEEIEHLNSILGIVDLDEELVAKAQKWQLSTPLYVLLRIWCVNL